jgi:hypothetical protein
MDCFTKYMWWEDNSNFSLIGLIKISLARKTDKILNWLYTRNMNETVENNKICKKTWSNFS